jgi:hypothetical protein
MRQQRNSIIRRSSVRVLFGKRLTGSAAAEENGTTPMWTNQSLKSVRAEASQVRFQEFRPREVPAESGRRVRVDVKSEEDLHPGSLQASACPTATGEEIENFDLHRSLTRTDRVSH